MKTIQRIALIPAYMPGESMKELAFELSGKGYAVIIVNDGSPSEYDPLFGTVGDTAVVLKHKKNMGKGAALKTGLHYIREHFAHPYVVVNADADGQHRVEDILKVTETAVANPGTLVLGSRRFEGRIPLRSRLGNMVTRAVYRMAAGQKLIDTQTGLRAYYDSLVDKLMELEGDGYEYEMNMLLTLPRDGYVIFEEVIQTVYIAGNRSSHFKPVRDSFRIYREILRFSASSLMSFAADYGLFCVLSAITKDVVLSNVLSRVMSGTLNFTLNKKLVFESRENILRAALKYAALAGVILACNTLMVEGLVAAGMHAYLAKILTEMLLFAVSYLVQHAFVFRRRS